jgi:outer membrane protein OmpA-like peptidoglycan-associated protein
MLGRPLRRAFAAAKVRRNRRRAFALGALVALVAVAVALALRSADEPGGATDSAEGVRVPRHAGPEGGPAPSVSRSTAVSALIEFLSSDAAQDEYAFVLDGVEFEPASATLKSTSNAQLKEVATALAAFPRSRITLEARADGESEDERELAERRAVAVRAALAVFGVPLSRTNHASVRDTDRPVHSVEARVTRR